MSSIASLVRGGTSLPTASLKRLAIVMACLAATPAAADEVVPYDLAQSRLRGCVIAGTEGAALDNLQAALIAVRSLCLPRIHVLYDASDRRVAAENPQARAGDLADLKKEARRKIDYDIAVAVAKIGGLQP